MKAVAVTPGKTGSVRIINLPKPNPTGAQALLRIDKIGIDGTDLEINQGAYGEAPSGSDYLISGHECLTTVSIVETGNQTCASLDSTRSMGSRASTASALNIQFQTSTS